MAERIVLHIGAPKSGTTYLQTALWQSRAALKDAGVLVPGRKLVDYNRAAVAVRTPRRGEGPAARTWQRLVEETRRWPGVAVLSSEWFCLTTEELARRTVEELGQGNVQVVYTARAYASQVPAAWQEQLKLGAPQTLSQFVDELDAPGRRWSWWTLDPADALSRWDSWVGPDNVKVVTVPPRGSSPDLLLSRFAEAAGFDAGTCRSAVPVPNESLGVEAAELMRRVAPRVREEVDLEALHWTEQYRWLRRYLAHEVLVPRGGSRIGLSTADLERLEARAGATATRLRDRGYEVVGDLADLTGQGPAPDGVRPDEVTAEEMLAVAVPVIVQLLGRVREETLRAEQAEKALADKEESR